MLAPGLREGLELAVGRVAAEVAEVVLDGPHLGEAQVELPCWLRSSSASSSIAADRHLDAPEVVGMPLAEPVERQGADDRLLDGVVGQDALDQPGQGLGRARRSDRSGSSGRSRRRSRGRGGSSRALWPSGSVTPGLGQDVDDGPASRRPRRRLAGR